MDHLTISLQSGRPYRFAELTKFIVSIMDGGYWRNIEQLVDAFFKKGVWSNGDTAAVVERITVFVPDNIHFTQLERCLEGIPLDELVPNGQGMTTGFHRHFFREPQRVNLYEFFNDAQRRFLVMDAIYIEELNSGGPLISRKVTDIALGLFSVTGKDGTHNGMSQVINQWCRKGYLNRDTSVKGKPRYSVAR